MEICALKLSMIYARTMLQGTLALFTKKKLLVTYGKLLASWKVRIYSSHQILKMVILSCYLIVITRFMTMKTRYTVGVSTNPNCVYLKLYDMVQKKNAKVTSLGVLDVTSIRDAETISNLSHPKNIDNLNDFFRVTHG